MLAPSDVPIRGMKAPRDAKVARLARGLQRVLFAPGVHSLRDPRTGVWNFEPELGEVPVPEDFAFHRLPQYITASKDDELAKMAEEDGLRFIGSTSTLTQALSQIYFTLSGECWLLGVADTQADAASTTPRSAASSAPSARTLLPAHNSLPC